MDLWKKINFRFYGWHNGIGNMITLWRFSISWDNGFLQDNQCLLKAKVFNIGKLQFSFWHD